jgi:putative Mg2+ transporter-C (MgtC) family protein
MMADDPWQWFLRLGLAAVVGALIGGERESRGHPAGVRTQSLVALTAALLAGAGKTGFIGVAVDTSRIASQVISGIGFIGAGVILKGRGNVTGLTTAATLFLSAGIGVAIGADLIVAALITTGIALVVIYGLRAVKPLLRRNLDKSIHVDYLQGHGTFGPLVRSVQAAGGTIRDLLVEDESDGAGNEVRHVSMQIECGPDSDLEEAISGLASRPEVIELHVEDR